MMHQIHTSKSALISIVLVLLLVSCSVQQYGFSGMADIDDDKFLVVHDLKSFQDGSRVSVIHSHLEENYEIFPVRISGWSNKDDRSSDLEAVCDFSEHANQYLLVESGNWDSRDGQIFHVEISAYNESYRATVIKPYKLEIFDPKGKNDEEGDQFEGIVCAHIDAGKYLVLLGERGGSTPFPHGIIRWFEFDVEARSGPIWSIAGKRGINIVAPGDWTDPIKNRDITALHLDQNILWAAAAEEPEQDGNTGPFYSVIYQIGEIDVHGDKPIRDFCEEDKKKNYCSTSDPLSPYSVWRTIEGFKVEGLAGPPQQIGHGEFSIGTEDESFAGAWRPIRKPPPNP